MRIKDVRISGKRSQSLCVELSTPLYNQSLNNSIHIIAPQARDQGYVVLAYRLPQKTISPAYFLSHIFLLEIR